MAQGSARFTAYKRLSAGLLMSLLRLFYIQRRSVFAPHATSRNTLVQPAFVSCWTCAATLWPSVDTRA